MGESRWGKVSNALTIVFLLSIFKTRQASLLRSDD